MAPGKPFTVDTRPTKLVVVDGLTRDASVQACIFDLIDNSIDAAQEAILAALPPDERDHLPESYKKYQIDISFDGAAFRIKDNCGGISVDKLKTLVMRFGERSSHPFGIGVFGVGLNRALFKLGKLSRITTDTGSQRAEFTLDVDEYLRKKNEWTLSATEFPSTGDVGTDIRISELPEDIALNFATAAFEEELRSAIGRRYGHFIAKKLSIRVNKDVVESQEIKIRENPPVEYRGDYKFLKTKDGVQIHVWFGQHDEHRFSNERGWDRNHNATLTTEYGWNVLCNDRVILFSDQSRKTGWDTKLHTEHYGFVGYVSFVGDPEKLPWNTTKTDIDLNNEAYGMALKAMRLFSEQWRALADKRKNAKAPPRQLPPKKPSKPFTSRKPPAKAERPPKPTVKVDHQDLRTILPSDINEEHCADKFLRLVHEAKNLDLADLTYAGLALVRMLFEHSTATFLTRHNRYGELVKFGIETYEKKLAKTGRTLSEEEKKKFSPKIDDMIPFLHNNPDVWGAAKAQHLRHSLSEMGKHQSKLNGVVHNTWQTVHVSEAFQIRDAVLPLLRHLIET